MTEPKVEKTARKSRGRFSIQVMALLLGLCSPFLLYLGLEGGALWLAGPGFGLLLLAMLLTLWAA